ncbi:MAG: DUF445 family protein [Cyclobacteriaceae bacterium]|nr:DUF445 family protein [Cyclobacteriaceae bacterium]
MLYYSLPLIAALTGWITNFLAIKMLFHPRRKIDLYFFSLQGIFPKRQERLAEKLGSIVARELFSIDDIKKRFTSSKTAEDINQMLDEKLEDFLENKLKESLPMASFFLGAESKKKIKEKLHEEFQNILPEVLNVFSGRLEKDLDIENVVFTKVSAFSSKKLEEILFSIMKKEFKLIEILGGVLGFFIGLLQLLIVKLA